jgi:hypothetical protein
MHYHEVHAYILQRLATKSWLRDARDGVRTEWHLVSRYCDRRPLRNKWIRRRFTTRRSLVWLPTRFGSAETAARGEFRASSCQADVYASQRQCSNDGRQAVAPHRASNTALAHRASTDPSLRLPNSLEATEGGGFRAASKRRRCRTAAADETSN